MALIDIVLPIYKSEDIIYQSIQSVINQSYKNWHLFIIDDASGDNRLDEIKKKYGNYEGKISYIQFLKNQRAAACRNHAIQNGKGEFIAFIDQDDVWMQEKLQNQIDYMCKTGVNAVHSNIQFIDYHGNIIRESSSDNENSTRRDVDWHNSSNIELANQLFLQPNIRIISSMVSRDLFEKIGGFQEKHFGGEDEIFWFEVAYHGKIGYIDEILIQRREHENNTVKIYKADRYIGYLEAIIYLKNNYYHVIINNFSTIEKAISYSLINLLRREKEYFSVIKYTFITLLKYPLSTTLKIINRKSKEFTPLWK